MLKSDEILDFLKQHKQDIETRFSVKRIGLFGSVLRGSASDISDVDILVELAHPTFDQYMDLKFFLEEKLGRPVDLVLADSLKPRLQPIITREVAYATPSSETLRSSVRPQENCRTKCKRMSRRSIGIIGSVQSVMG